MFDGNQDRADQQNNEAVEEEAMGNPGCSTTSPQCPLRHDVGDEAAGGLSPVESLARLAAQPPQSGTAMKTVEKAANRTGCQQVKKAP
jgi:hypothetical protein